jgi:LAO/AO transport system kinase
MDAAALDRRDLARALSAVESGDPAAEPLLRRIAPGLGRAPRIGVTGSPGVGKSTLVSALVRAWRARGRSVAVVAVDPTSPVTGGALLGDRLRMAEHATDPGVFVRSLASRGHTGGLAAAAGASLDLLEAAGFDLLVLETVGAGQSEIGILGEADPVLVVVGPGAGDSVQAMKSGILEVGGLWVVNKADRPEAALVHQHLLAALELGPLGKEASARVHLVSASDGQGIEGLAEAALACVPGGDRELARRRMLRRRLEAAVLDRVRTGLPRLDLEGEVTALRAGRSGLAEAAAGVLQRLAPGEARAR